MRILQKSQSEKQSIRVQSILLTFAVLFRLLIFGVNDIVMRSIREWSAIWC